MKKLFVKLLCLTAVFVLLFANISAVSVLAKNDYPDLQLGKQESGKLSDYWGSVKFDLILSRDYTINFNYTSTVKSQIVVRDSKWKAYLNENNIKKCEKSVSLKKGSYTVSLYNNTFKNGTYTLKASDATEYAEKIEFYKQKYKLSVGKGITLPLKCIPEGTQPGDISWSTSNKKVATVNSSGYVKGKALGAVTITAKLSNGNTASTVVCVNSRSYTIKKGSSKKLPTINSKSVSWKNNKPKIIKIKKGKFKGKAKGKGTLTKTVSKNKYTVTIKVV